MNKFLTNLPGKCTDALKLIEKTFVKDSPQILTGLGVAGFVTAIALAVKATPEAEEAIEEEKIKRSDEAIAAGSEPEPLSVPDVIRVSWKYYIPTAVTALGSAACVIGSTSISYQRNAAIAAAYTLSETALSEYKEAAIETVGEKKEEAIQAKATENHVKQFDLKDEDFYWTGGGETRCFDIPSGRAFRSSREKVEHAVNMINERLFSDNEMWVTENDFYYELGLPPTDNGEQLGWSVEKGHFYVKYSSMLLDNREPVLTIDYDVTPFFKSY